MRHVAFPMAVRKQLASLLNPFRFIVSYHDRSTLLQKIDRNKERVFSTPLNYASLNTCKGSRSNAYFHALRQGVLQEKAVHQMQ